MANLHNKIASSRNLTFLKVKKSYLQSNDIVHRLVVNQYNQIHVGTLQLIEIKKMVCYIRMLEESGYT